MDRLMTATSTSESPLHGFDLPLDHASQACSYLGWSRSARVSDAVIDHYQTRLLAGTSGITGEMAGVDAELSGDRAEFEL